MKTVSILELRRDAERIIRMVERGKRLILTYRGKPVLRLEPLTKRKISADDPFYRLPQVASDGGKPITNEEIDRIVYADGDVR